MADNVLGLINSEFENAALMHRCIADPVHPAGSLDVFAVNRFINDGLRIGGVHFDVGFSSVHYRPPFALRLSDT